MSQNVKFFSYFFLCPIGLAVVVVLLFGGRDGGKKEGRVEDVWDEFKSYFYNTPHPQAFMTTPQIIQSLGYTVEEHKVRTKDGYILTLFRIPRGQNGAPQKWHPTPVIIQHGILCNSVDWLLLAQDSLPIQLANDGHEVWLTNTRGSHYALEHETLHQDDVKFWDYGLDEIGKEDVPMMINYILATAGTDSVNWIGHSMGCTMLFVAIDQDPGLNAKVNKMTCFAPAVYVKNIICPAFKFASYFSASSIQSLSNCLSGGRFLPRRLNNFFKAYGPYFCSGRIAAEFCNAQVFLFTGFNREQTTEKTGPWVAGHMPSETSAKTLAHYAQFIVSGKFQAFDYGEVGNLEKYGSPIPPPYNLAKVTVPILAFYGLNDWLVTPEDARATLSQLGNVTETIVVDHVNWNHMDFLYGRSAPVLFHQRILKYMGS